MHRFLRAPHLDSNVYNRIANRFSPFTNTLTTLADPATQRTLTLIGTTNASSTLAHRTKLLLEKVKPDAVYVQASPDWWNYAKHVNVHPISCRCNPNSCSRRPPKTSLSPPTNLKTTSEASFSVPAT